MKLTLGTGAFLTMNCGEKCMATYGGLYPIVAWKIGDKVTYCMEGVEHTSGRGIEWLAQLGLVANVKETEQVAQEVPDTGGVVVVPALFGKWL